MSVKSLTILSVLGLLSLARADDPGAKKVSDALAVVVKTVPAAGSEDVAPATEESRVTFSKEMTDKSWSWATAAGYGADIGGDDIRYGKDTRPKVCPCGNRPPTLVLWDSRAEVRSGRDVPTKSVFFLPMRT